MADNPKSGAHLIATYLMPLSIFALAGALIYFAYEVSRVSVQIPEILESVNHTTDKVAPVIGEIGEIQELVPDILHEVEQTRQLVPPILEEVEQIRLQIPPVLTEVKQTRQQIPPILKEVEAVRKEIPAVLKSADQAVDALAGVSKQVEATRPLIEQALDQVEITRESIPPMLDRADAMIDKARTAGKEASSGAVTGFFKGLITTPFALVGDAGKAITGMSAEELKQYSDKDFDLIEIAALDLLNNGERNDSRELNNPDSGFSGTVKLVSIDSREEDFTTIDCRTLQMEAYKDGARTKTVNKTFCREEGSGWEFDQ